MQHAREVHLLPSAPRGRLALGVRCRSPVAQLLLLLMAAHLPLALLLLMWLLLLLLLLLCSPLPLSRLLLLLLLHLALLCPLPPYAYSPASLARGMLSELGAARRRIAVVGGCLAVHCTTGLL